MEANFPDVVRPFLKFHTGGPLTADARLFDLGLDSMQAVELLFAIEDAYGIEIPDDKLRDATFETLGSLWDAVAEVAADTSRILS
jgi:acyl carrier protein